MKQTFEINGISYAVETENEVTVSLYKLREENDITVLKLTLDFGGSTLPKPLSVTYEIPCTEMYTMWDAISKKRDLDASWRVASGKTVSSLANGMPLKGLFSKEGINRYLLAFSDVKTPLAIKMGASHYRGAMLIRWDLFTRLCGPFTHYETEIHIDSRAIPFDRAVLSARKWYDEIGARLKNEE